MERFIIWGIILAYAATMLIIGIRTAKKTKTLTDFVVGGRKAGPWMSAFAYGTTYFSAVLFIGYAGRSGWDFGLWAVLIGVGNAFLGSWLAWKVLAGRTREVTRRLKIKSMSQLFEKRYNSRLMKLVSCAVIFIFMTPYSASVYSGLSYLFETVLKIDYQYVMIGIALVAAAYLVLGGYLASLKADFVQGIIMIAGVIVMVVYIVYAPKSNGIPAVGGFIDGIGDVWNKMSTAGLTQPKYSTITGVLSLILLTSMGTWGMPQMIHKFYGVADDNGIKKGTIISTGFCAIISIGAYFVGSLAIVLFDQIPGGNYDLIIPTILVNKLPALILGVIIVLVLSASVSTLSGITLTACSTLTMDLIASSIKPNMDQKKELTLTRVLCLLFIACSCAIASFKSPILVLMSFSWGCIAGAFLAPYLLGLFWKRMTKVGGWCGMLGGLGTALTLSIMSITKVITGVGAPLIGVIAMVVSFGCCFVGTALTWNRCQTDKNEFFDKPHQVEQAS